MFNKLNLYKNLLSTFKNTVKTSVLFHLTANKWDAFKESSIQKTLKFEQLILSKEDKRLWLFSVQYVQDIMGRKWWKIGKKQLDLWVTCEELT